jgi:hypothetical protein
MFSRELVQAVSGWQRGGDARQKLRRGNTLRAEALRLPKEFRECDGRCFRQLSLPKESFWQLADEFELPEAISAWTLEPRIARQLKGGVPYPGQQGVIFAVFPPAGAIIANLHRLFADPDFRAAVERHKTDVTGFHNGIGRYGNEQCEVVLEISVIALSDIFELGGFSSERDELLRKCFGQNPTPEQIANFDRNLAEADETVGPDWVGDEAKDRVIAKIKAIMPTLRTFKKLQETIGATSQYS